MAKRTKKPAKKTIIHIGAKARQRIQQLYQSVRAFKQYVAGVRDTLNVPADWVMLPDGSGFAPPKGGGGGK